MNKPILLVMAAGMGSRYGGLKQADAVGQNGEAIIDYSIYDAIRAGFRKAIIIIKKEFETEFKERIGNRISEHIELKYVYQELDDLPKGYEVPNGREKPWGTCQAVLSAKELIDAPFAVINADDYYGPDAFKIIYDFLKNCKDDTKYNYAMVGYILGNTLTENGHVSRAVCTADESGYLQNIVERTHIQKNKEAAHYTEDGGATWTDLDINSIVSMNLWGFSQSFLNEAEKRFPKFLDDALKTNPLKAEYFLPGLVDQLLNEEKARVKVLKSNEKWYGLTYKADKEMVVNAISEKHKAGQYKTPLWQRSIKLDEALDAYDFGGVVTDIFPYGKGHINDTFCVCVKNSDREDKYILQRINSKVFKEPLKLMENIFNVTNYLKSEIIKNGKDYKRETLNLIETKENNYCYTDSDNEIWRVFYFVDDTFCFDSVEKPEHFYESAKSFGKFMGQLSDFPVEKLHETIPRFHDTPNRLENFKKAVSDDKLGRVSLVKEEIDFALSREKDCAYLMNKLANGELPLRVTHNDTKLNNVLIDRKTQKGICVVDLDTIMPGLCANDFGDSIRFGASTALEDEPDTSIVHFDLELFEIYTKGYLEVTSGILTDEERKSLVWGAKLMTLECGIRFLTDYLNGDTYFKINRENQNLDRARTQFKLVYEMEQNFDTMLEIVKKY